jgi:alkylated DNA repair dioxygenase AlkB
MVALERLELDERSWVDVARGWYPAADELYAALTESVPWRQGRLFRYERWVDEPRLGSWWAPGQPAPHPAIPALPRLVRNLCGRPFEGMGLAWYRDGRDSVAFHRDRDLRWLDDTVIVLLTLGERRPWLLRPRTGRHDRDAPEGGAIYDLAPAGGDLLILGGASQVGWEHAVPRVPGRRGGRISLQWRWTSRTGRPEQGPGYRAPRLFSRDGSARR